MKFIWELIYAPDILWAYRKKRADYIYGVGVRFFSNKLSAEDVKRHRYEEIGQVDNAQKQLLLLKSFDIIPKNDKERMIEFTKLTFQSSTVCLHLLNRARAVYKSLYIGGWLTKESFLHLMTDTDFLVTNWDVEYLIINRDLENPIYGWKYSIKGYHFIYRHD